MAVTRTAGNGSAGHGRTGRRASTSRSRHRSRCRSSSRSPTTRSPRKSARRTTPRSTRRSRGSKRMPVTYVEARAALACCRETVSSRRRSGIAPAAPATRTSTPTSWSPTSLAVPTASGVHPTAACCSVVAKTAGHLYEAQLRHELTARLGVEWQPVRNGIADLAGIPRSLIEHLSQRRQAVLDRLDELGMASARAAQIATLDTRAPKDLTVDLNACRIDWQQAAAEHGIDADTITQLTGQSGPTRSPIGDDNRSKLRSSGPTGSPRTARPSTAATCSKPGATSSAPVHPSPRSKTSPITPCRAQQP